MYEFLNVKIFKVGVIVGVVFLFFFIVVLDFFLSDDKDEDDDDFLMLCFNCNFCIKSDVVGLCVCIVCVILCV